MNLGNIPGFYYDEVKKKYFQIRAHHVVPKDAQYSRSNVKREQRQTKRRKKDREQQQVRRRQTVTHPRALEHAAIGGIGVLREHGTQRLAELRTGYDRFLLSQLQSSYMWPGDCGLFRDADTQLQDLHFSRHTQNALMAFRQGDGRSFSHYSPRLPLGTNSCVYPSDHWTSSQSSAPSATHGEAFFSSIASTSLSWSASHAAEGILVCAQTPHRLGNIYLSYVRDEGPHMMPSAAIRLCLGRKTNYLWASAFRDGADVAAVSGSEDIFIINHEGNVVHRLRIPSESRAVAWLDHNLLLYGQHTLTEGTDQRETSFSSKPFRPPPRDANTTRGLMLWDLRTSGRALRFHRPAPITGLLAPPGSHGLHVLAATNHEIALFDTRVPTLPLLSFSHTHQGPQCPLTTHPSLGHLVAAVDRDNGVQIYSSRTAKAVTTLAPPDGVRGPLIRGLKWYEDLDDAGELLIGCQGSRVVRWGMERV
nr:hypothetical protein CFP56_28573 [Quercus suber]